MKIVAAVCNVVWFLFTCLVIVTDGLPERSGYLVGSLLLLLVPLLTLVALLRPGAGGPIVKVGAIVGNIALLGFVAASLLLLPPHPAEEGYVPYVILAALTPVLSLIAITLGGRRGPAKTETPGAPA